MRTRRFATSSGNDERGGPLLPVRPQELQRARRLDRHQPQGPVRSHPPWLPLYEGFFTYGGMSSKEIEAMAVGMREMTELEVAGSSADAIKYFVGLLLEKGVPVVTPAGGLACHVDAMRFIDHVPQSEYPAGALAAAVYIASGIRGMERGSVSMDRDAKATTCPRTWNCCAWPCRGASTPCRTSSTPPTA
jgi:hypothetical protein